MSSLPRVHDLREHERVRLHGDALTNEEGEILWQQHRTRISVEFPSPRTEGQWELSCQGWVGFLPVTRELGLRLQPKVPLANLFGMLEYAYRLKGFYFLPGLIDCNSLEEFYEHLAHVLARRVLDRARKGFHREYLFHEDRLPFLRGRLDVQRALRAPWEVRLDCQFQEHTADIEDNQILAWTLSRILRTAACRREDVLGSVRSALRSIQGLAMALPVSPKVCDGRVYTRLNDDYRPLHVLCRFLLEQSGPSHEQGDGQSLPFLVDMASLFELFVSEWLQSHLSPGFTVRAQEKVRIAKELEFSIDLVLYQQDGLAACVLDTKYKAAPVPSAADVQQVVAYAVAKRCREAVLVYPSSQIRPFEVQVGEIRIRSLAFDLSGDLERAGRNFQEELLLGLESPPGRVRPGCLQLRPPG
jgi:5-methylcytosine-specific restriction enzyme subunit McrC